MLAAPNTTTDAVFYKARFFRGFSDPSRLSILETLAKGPCSVGEIVQRTGLGQPNVSNHLACLRDCGLVTARAQGRSMIYRLSDERVGKLLESAGELLEEVASGVYTCLRLSEAEKGVQRG
jgi:DNA-binding transcriptional ArsR family regulator